MRSIILSALVLAVNAVLLPSPSGDYAVAMEIHAFEDFDRVDPYAPASEQHWRKLVTSIFWPVQDTSSCEATAVHYMPPATAGLYGQQAAAMGLGNDTFASLAMEVCKVERTHGCIAGRRPQYPLAIFSRGAGNSRLLYSGGASFLASQGLVVVTVDHPYDASIVEFPDGGIILSANISEETGPLEELTKTRTEDISFVLTQLQDLSSTGALKHLPGSIDFDKAVVLGHSLGGSSAAMAVMTDARFQAGVNMDGRLVEPALTLGLSKPFLLLGRPNHAGEDATWDQFWGNLRGPAAEVSVNGTVHGSFTDFPQVVDALDLPDSIRPLLDALIGAIDFERVPSILAETLSNFFSSVFNGSMAAFSDAVAELPEVSILQQHVNMSVYRSR